ncbi:MAG: NAD-dependent epimerase/dehydratase family protein [Clostridiales bacterium]|jgi:UDP-glucose 4-epimerase|nr:NAD-dependent epimerase/dehydratase family protein [Clostridiales bacterium]
MNYFITGGAGFIGSSMADALAKDLTNKITVYDNFSTGFEEFLLKLKSLENVEIIRGDLLDESKLSDAMARSDFVFHFAANADVRFGLKHPRKDLEQNTIATFNVLEAMRKNGIDKIAFSSTGSVYGEATKIPTPEDSPFPIQTSLYASSKLAGEAMISSYCEGYGFTGYIFRFVSILGERYTHGHVFDFYKKLMQDPNELYVLGNGKQRKSYLYVQDCLRAIFAVIQNTKEKVNIYNLGTDEYCEVNDSIKWICEYLNLSPKLIYSGGEHGWIGDNPFIFLDCSKVKSLGWHSNTSIKDAVIKTVKYIEQNKWIYTARKGEANA